MTYYKLEKETKIGDYLGARAFISLAVIGVFIALSVFYLMQVNNLIGKNFELRGLQKNLAKSEQENQVLSVNLTQMRSLGNLERAAKNLNLISIDKPGYLKMTPGTFALSE